MPSLPRTPRRRRLRRGLLAASLALACWLAGGLARAEETPRVPDPAAGYRHMLDTPYVPATVDPEVFESLWKTWDEPARKRAAAADAEARREMVYARYGFTPRPGDPDGPPLQLTQAENGNLALNCFTCHGGTLRGEVVPGLPNVHIALQSFVDDVRATRRLLKRPFGLADVAAQTVPHGETVGTTNAVVFSIVLLQFRDEHLNVVPPKRRLHLPHHDLDAPPWWHYKKRSHLYVDGFAKPGHRALMQFLLVPQNGRDKVLAWEDDFRDIEAWIRQTEPPAWPFEVDADLAAQGRRVFEKTCASCHGTYGEDGRYPNRLVPLAKVGTDPARLAAIRNEDRARYAKSWLTDYDPEGVRLEARGYVAPPLDGIWATAPYFHNGAVPTLWHVLHPGKRPAVWRRDAKAYDEERVGLVIETRDAVPEGLTPHERRQWFDTSAHGKSAAGHTFPDRLTSASKRALLEYLKTL